jgi:molybdate transport system regulatory protein
MTRLTVRIDFDAGGGFGPGKARLLELIEELSSLRRAAAAMEMSYRQAWLLVQAAEEIFGAKLVETATGGAHGGGSRLTDKGREVLARYRAVEAKSAAAAKSEMAALTRLATGTAANRAKRKLRRKSA